VVVAGVAIGASFTPLDNQQFAKRLRVRLPKAFRPSLLAPPLTIPPVAGVTTNASRASSRR